MRVADLPNGGDVSCPAKAYNVAAHILTRRFLPAAFLMNRDPSQNLTKGKSPMPNFRRYYRPGALVFITSVTRKRRPYFESDQSIELFFVTMHNVQRIYPFRLFAYVILPDHFHWLMCVEDEMGNFSKVMHSVKRNYTFAYKQTFGITGSLQLWQPRFWDHLIRDAGDLQNHFDYIHWNPVKHGYVSRPEDWPHSTYRYWLDRGYYQQGWGHEIEPHSTRRLDLG